MFADYEIEKINVSKSGKKRETSRPRREGPGCVSKREVFPVLCGAATDSVAHCSGQPGGRIQRPTQWHSEVFRNTVNI